MNHIAFTTYKEEPLLSTDDALALRPLAKVGISVAAAAWDDEAIDWARFDAVVMRSCWNYYLHAARFQKWFERVAATGVRFINPLELLRWNFAQRVSARPACTWRGRYRHHSPKPVKGVSRRPCRAARLGGASCQTTGLEQRPWCPALPAAGVG